MAKYLGDGVLAYFGWPQAYEDQAERAIRAGLDAVEVVNDVRIGDGHSLEARVGIATSQVVVGDLVGESGRDAEAVTGETPNLAARLQGLAEPGADPLWRPGDHARLHRLRGPPLRPVFGRGRNQRHLAGGQQRFCPGVIS